MSDRIRVFISYTHDSEQHRHRVLTLAQRLRRDGIECTIDQFVAGSPPEGWPRWMEQQVAEADFVPVVCTETYLRRYNNAEAPGTSLGATWEAFLTRQELYDGQGENKKFVPVLLEEGDRPDGAEQNRTQLIPRPLRPFTYHILPGGYNTLYRYLTSQPKVIPEAVGTKRVLPPDP